MKRVVKTSYAKDAETAVQTAKNMAKFYRKANGKCTIEVCYALSRITLTSVFVGGRTKVDRIYWRD